jgi:hypothetical protein
MLEVITKNKFALFNDKSILEDGVEFIGLINKQGNMENTIFKNEINLTKERKEMFSMELRLQSSMQSDFDLEFGPVSHTVTERKKLKFVSMLAFPYIVLVIMKKNIDHIAVIKKIKTKIQNFDNANIIPTDKWSSLNMYDMKSIHCFKCDRFMGEIYCDSVVVLPQCGHCANPMPEGDDRVLFTVNKFNKDPKI